MIKARAVEAAAGWGAVCEGLGKLITCLCFFQLTLHSLSCYEELVLFLQQSIQQVYTGGTTQDEESSSPGRGWP